MSSDIQKPATDQREATGKKGNPSLQAEIQPLAKSRVIWRSMWLGFIPGLFVAVIICLLAPHMRELIFFLSAKGRTTETMHADVNALKKEQAQLKREIARLRRRSDRLTPSSTFLIISSSDNKFTLMKGKRPIREGICSTGSNVLLKTSDNRRWIFRTPTGILRIRDKLKSPIWRKPDWAFIEEGKDVPAPLAEERFDFGALGEYGLTLGDGYLIHGTLYQRMLGMPVTHGCIRLGDDDLRAIYLKLRVGSKVFIY